MDGMSVKQSIEIETKNHTALMMGVTPAGQFKVRDIPEETQWQY